MNKGYFGKEIAKALDKLATGNGVLRERVTEAYADMASARACSEGFFEREFAEIEDFFVLGAKGELKNVSEQQLKIVASTVLNIYTLLPEFVALKQTHLATR